MPIASANKSISMLYSSYKKATPRDGLYLLTT
jgi:hypothetical protein